MYYVEYLRASRAVRVAAIAITAALLVNMIIWRAGGVNVEGLHLVLPLTIVWAVAGLVASGFASALANSLASENDGHLPAAWTKPVSRSSHALTKMLVDLSAVAAVFLMSCAAVFAYFSFTGFIRWLSVPADTWFQLARFALAPIAVYGLLQCATASLGRGAGWALGCTWFVLFVLGILGSGPILPQPYSAIVSFLNLANPLVYIELEIAKNGTIITYNLAAATIGLIIIGVCGAAAAIYQWQRVEA
jgi:hypothetical protein